MRRRVTILGATGSVGQSTVELLAQARDSCRVVALTGADNVAQLARDAIALQAQLAVTAREERLDDLRTALAGSGIEATAGKAALVEAAQRPADWVISAILGAAGLRPGLAALEQGAVLALANKEALVCAGGLLKATAERSGGRILPVDSELSAVFQVLEGERIERVERIIITASGGAFRDWPVERLALAAVEEAARHPNWNMGKRITIDSASMFNKALEMIETREFFGVRPKQIEVLLHPQSLVHALVGFVDGGLLAHLGPADMRHAIGYALNWPDRRNLPVSRLDLARIGKLEFSTPDLERYPALGLARAVMDRGGLAGTVFNAAKERALDAFVDGKIAFTHMACVVSDVLDRAFGSTVVVDAGMTLENVLDADSLARIWADELIARRMG